MLDCGGVAAGWLAQVNARVMTKVATGNSGVMVEDLPAGNQVFRQRVQVAFDYAVCFTRGVFRGDNPLLNQVIASREPGRRHRLFVVIDSGVARAWPGLSDQVVAYCEAYGSGLELADTPKVIPGGERAKQSPGLILELQQEMRRLRIDRQSFVVAVGGGAVLDAVGYAAATTHRGVRLVRVPTTVLGQNDSGVGVKNGVNAFGSKNFLGTFAPPFAVLNDLDFIATLSVRDKRSGMAEAVKVALIRDRTFFAWLEARRDALARFDADAMAEMIRRAAEIHMTHIAQAGDPFEMGSARPLDFGHWAAHRLESVSDHALRHGEAVAIGLALDCRYSVACGLLAPEVLTRVSELLSGLGFSLWHAALERIDPSGAPSILEGLREFREHLGGELCVTLLTDVGRTVEVHEMDTSLVLSSLAWLRERFGGPCV